jgi:hypothetical protein
VAAASGRFEPGQGLGEARRRDPASLAGLDTDSTSWYSIGQAQGAGVYIGGLPSIKQSHQCYHG